MLVISPHLDDAVLSCGNLLASRPGSTVLTVFAGAPHHAAEPVTPWDAACGFRNAHEAIGARRAEDRAALSLLGAQPLWLEFCDSQYGETPPVEELRDALKELLLGLGDEMVLYPMGLYHSDHLLVHDASRAALRSLPGARFLVYEDALYRGMKGVLQQRLAAFAAHGCRATPARLACDAGTAALKARAVQAYASQLRAFGAGGYDDAAQPERFWTLDDSEAQHAA